MREPAECAGGMIEGAVNMPLGRLEREGTAALPVAFEPGAALVVYCAAGARSLRAVRLLREHHGFRDVRSLRLGLRGW